MLTFKTLVAAALLGGATFLSTGCNPQPVHSNQINTFDGASYDSLTLAHAALTSLRESVSTTFPQYKTPFNLAAASYGTAFEAYSLFRAAPNSQAAAAVAIANLTVSVVSLENTFQADMHAAPKDVQQIRGRAARFRSAAQSKITISDILAELEIAASVAATIPGSQPYSTIAELVIKMTEQAIAANHANSGQAIDLSTIQPVAQIQ